MSSAKDRIMDAIDIQSFLFCNSEKEARTLIDSLMQELGLGRYVIVSLEFNGPGANFHARAYLNKPGDTYSWLKGGIV